MSSLSLTGNNPLFHVIHPDGDSMFDPKWFVGGFALGGLALIFSYDFSIGLMVTPILAVLGAMCLAIRIWLASEPDERISEREALFKRFSKASRNRREARIKELGAKGGPDAG